MRECERGGDQLFGTMWAFRSLPNTRPILCLVTRSCPLYISNMMFENELTPTPSVKSQIVKHLPIAAIVLGVLAAFVALHVAITGVLIAAAAHVVLGLGLLGIRRHRTTSSATA